MIDRVGSNLGKHLPESITRKSRSLLRYLQRVPSSDFRYSVAARFNPNIHQTSALTALDRYPEVFARAKGLLAAHPFPRILSFGCSTGEEVLTLRQYFPDATIVGAELNRSRLRKCRQRISDPDTSFVKSTENNIKKSGPYHAIFAMAVLQRTPHKVHKEGVQDLSGLYPYSAFNAQLKKFDANLYVGGLIVLQHTQYRFEDSEISQRYEVQGHAPPEKLLPSFDRHGQIISGQPYNEIIFRKMR
ncbi:MAG: methyltransferase domain-containing protein [Pseudomonadota bacterium]